MVSEAYGKHQGEMAALTLRPSDPEELLSVCAKNVKMAAIEWLWPDGFAVGKLEFSPGYPTRAKVRSSLLSSR